MLSESSTINLTVPIYRVRVGEEGEGSAKSEMKDSLADRRKKTRAWRAFSHPGQRGIIRFLMIAHIFHQIAGHFLRRVLYLHTFTG
jgi:hypothetical protein